MAEPISMMGGAGVQALLALGSALVQYQTRQQMTVAQRENVDRQLAFQREQYERQRRDALADAEQRRRDSLCLVEEQHVLQNWPLKLFPSQLLGHAGDAALSGAPTPLVILLSMPASQTIEGQALDIQGHVRSPLHQFLATHYSQNSSPRPVKLLDGAWKDSGLRGGASIEALHDRLDCLSTLVLEADLVQDALPFQFAWWGPLQEGYQYQHLGKFDWRELLTENARERARQWRMTRAELVRAGHAGDAAEADRKFGGENPANLRTLELEERLGDMPGIRLPPYSFAPEDFASLYRHLTAWYCLSTALVADLHHFRYNDTLPRLPDLLPGLLEGTRFPQPAMVELLLSAYEPLASERPDRARDLHRVLAGLPESPLGRSLLPRLVSIAEAETQAQAEAALSVQQRQQETAEALGLPVAFAHWLKDGGEGPQMLVIPAERFLMGSPASEPERAYDEGPQHQVTFARPFAIGRYAVTFAEYDAFCAATGRVKPGDNGWGRGQRPAINVSWDDAVAYCAWLSAQTGRTYRLPSEAEWEYAARAGTTTPFWWGDRIDPSLANYDGNVSYANGAKGEYRQQPLPVECFQPNPFGLYQVHGNIWEWCQDLWHVSYEGAPTDGAAWETGWKMLRVVRGGSWNLDPGKCRAACRLYYLAVLRGNDLGFRVCCVAPID